MDEAIRATITTFILLLYSTGELLITSTFA